MTAPTTWAICGAGRGVGKTHLAGELCRALPRAVYAKLGTHPAASGKPGNYFRSGSALAAFLEAESARHTHLVVEAHTPSFVETSDVVVFIDASPRGGSPRPDADRLRATATVRVGDGSGPTDWRAALAGRVAPPAVLDAVCGVLEAHARHLLRRDMARAPGSAAP